MRTIPVLVPLPPDLIIDISSRLPAKSLVRFLCLSKWFSRAIADPQFFIAHLQRSNASRINSQFVLPFYLKPLGLDSIPSCRLDIKPTILMPPSQTIPSSWESKIIGSCNGLLCLTNYEGPHLNRQLGLLNLSIERFKLLPLPPDSDASFNLVELGFGFDSSTTDFKVVRILHHRTHFTITREQVQVYSLQRNSWQVQVLSNPSSHTVPLPYQYLHWPRLVFNGAFYWVAKRTYGKGPSYLIWFFDFTDETLKEINLPPCFKERRINGMGEIVGKLYLLVHLSSYRAFGHGVSFELWTMTENSIWVVAQKIHMSVTNLPLCLGMSDEVILMRTHDIDCRLFSYDVEHQLRRDHKVVGNKHFPSAFTYRPSLALLEVEN